MKALVFERKLLKFGAARLASIRRSGSGAVYGPLSLDDDAKRVPLPGPEWHHVRPLLAGICGSDLATVDGRSSRYFETIVSLPFTPGHEIVGELDDGKRVVVEYSAALRAGYRPYATPARAAISGDVNGSLLDR
jgi:threonine dehydrogenase-like Zn-dependent dehydrogenase